MFILWSSCFSQASSYMTKTSDSDAEYATFQRSMTCQCEVNWYGQNCSMSAKYNCEGLPSMPVRSDMHFSAQSYSVSWTWYTPHSGHSMTALLQCTHHHQRFHVQAKETGGQQLVITVLILHPSSPFLCCCLSFSGSDDWQSHYALMNLSVTPTTAA